MDWKDLMSQDPGRFVSCLNKKMWKDFFVENAVNGAHSFRSLSQFFDTWNIDDFIFFVQRSGAKTVWQIEKMSNPLRRIARSKGFFTDTRFLEATQISSRNKWHSQRFTKASVDQFLLGNPEIQTVKEVDPGLIHRLKVQGVYEYLQMSLRLRRKEFASKEKNALSDIELTAQKMRNAIVENRMTSLKKIRNLSAYRYLRESAPDVLRGILLELGFKLNTSRAAKPKMNKDQKWIQRRFAKLSLIIDETTNISVSELGPKKAYRDLLKYAPEDLTAFLEAKGIFPERRVYNRAQTARDPRSIIIAEISRLESQDYKGSSISSEARELLHRDIHESKVLKLCLHLVHAQDWQTILEFDATMLAEALRLLKVFTYEYLREKFPVVEQALVAKGCLHMLNLQYEELHQKASES